MTSAAEETARILAAFEAAGAARVDLPVLQKAETLLDLYGEDIRARAYTTRDPLAGELMMRPDFTVPVVQKHLTDGATEARYVYAGKVFRMQELNSIRPSEYAQVGFEYLGGADAAEADAEVFALFAETLSDLPLRIATGDINILRAAVLGLTASDRRKRALLRHLWRPGRFLKLLNRFSGKGDMPAGRDDLIALARAGKAVPDASVIGLRTPQEIADRVAWLVKDADEPSIPAGEVSVIEAILNLDAKLPAALTALQALAADMPVIGNAVAIFATRLDALGARGVDIAAVDFEGSYGRTNMEYYDGFVFGFYADETPMPPVATGGRYDALARALGGEVPAVGGMIRPALTAELSP